MQIQTLQGILEIEPIDIRNVPETTDDDKAERSSEFDREMMNPLSSALNLSKNWVIKWIYFGLSRTPTFFVLLQKPLTMARVMEYEDGEREELIFGEETWRLSTYGIPASSTASYELLSSDQKTLICMVNTFGNKTLHCFHVEDFPPFITVNDYVQKKMLSKRLCVPYLFFQFPPMVM